MKKEKVMEKINRILSISDSYKAPERIMEILFNEELKKEIFFEFLKEFEYDLSYEWFYKYFQEEHADRKNNKQDFTPTCLSRLIAEIFGEEKQQGVIYEPAAGTGSTIISHWFTETRKCRFPWDYKPTQSFYFCEELSEKTVPFLLFNLMIRGINAIVVHGNSITREAKEIYFCLNVKNEFMTFSELYKMPHIEEVEEYYGVKFSDN